MQAWLDGMAPGYGAALMWTLAALIGLLILLVVIRIVRGLTFGTFVAGGRNRKARLAVMDATAVDSHRRLVLVRRDDVEHLILIGGPSDVVVEQNIRLVPQARRPVADDHAGDVLIQPQPEARQAPPQPRAAPVAPPAAPRPVPQPPPAAQQPPPPAAQQPVRAVTPQPAPRPAQAPLPPVSAPQIAAPTPAQQRDPRLSYPERPTNPGVTAVEPRAPSVSVTQKTEPRLDDALLEELEVTLDREHRNAPASQQSMDRSLDEEMSRLLGDLGAPRR